MHGRLHRKPHAGGPVLERFGWAELNIAILPLLAIAAAMTFAWMAADRAVRAQGAV